MSWLFPNPVLSVFLFVLWLLLVQSLSPPSLVVAAVVAVFWPKATAALRPNRTRIRRPLVLLQLVARAVFDMLRSNVEVARAILSPRSKAPLSSFVRIPLELQSPSGLAALAIIVTFTPGTAWAQLSADRRWLLIHVLAVSSEEEVVRSIKARYERPLQEIFE